VKAPQPWPAVLVSAGEMADELALDLAGTINDVALPMVVPPHGRASAQLHVIVARAWARDPHLVRDVSSLLANQGRTPRRCPGHFASTHGSIMQTANQGSNITFDFSGRNVIVTGAAQGIGRAVTTLFISTGASVTAVDLDIAPLEALAAESAGRLNLVAGDVADPTTARAAVAATGRRVDVLINNAGVLRDRVHWKLTDEDWTRVIDVHLRGTFNFIRETTPLMREAGYGRIINMTSYAGIRGNFGQANYSAAKAGIIGLTKAVAKEVATFGVTVNAISPNAQTSMIDSIPFDRREELRREAPMRRFSTTAELAPAIAFLASSEAGYITGVVLPVDGGISI
jgi:3-oxoacyl-[acyl-carrier protein] reductase